MWSSHLCRWVSQPVCSTSDLGSIPLVERCDFDENMAKLLRSLSPSDFSSCLQFVFEALSAGETALEMIARLIHLASLAIHNAPQSKPPLLRLETDGRHETADTLKTVQAFDKECLDVFVSNAKLSDAHITRSSMLIFISDLCSKRVRYCFTYQAFG
jgi:hypothetical protein